MRDLFVGLILFMLAIVLLSLPDQIKSPVLILISPGHALSVLDTVAMVPLLCRATIMQLFLWQPRNVLAEQFRRNGPIGILVTFAGGFGLGLLVASAFSLCSKDEQSRLATLPWCSATFAGRTAFGRPFDQF